MKLIYGILGGLVAGVIGALIWAAVVYFTHYEVGFIAWGIGFLVGAGVVMGSGGERSVPLGVAAGALSVGAILLGKWMWVVLILDHSADVMIADVADAIIEERIHEGKPASKLRDIGPDDPIRSMYPREIWSKASDRWNAYTPEQQALYRSAPGLLNPHLHLTYLSDEICNEWLAEGQTINWPGGYNFETAWRQSHYPTEIWAEAERRWNERTPAEQQEFMQWLTETQQAGHAQWRTSEEQAIFLDSFTFFDLFWSLLAVMTASAVAATNNSEP